MLVAAFSSPLGLSRLSHVIVNIQLMRCDPGKKLQSYSFFTEPSRI